MKGNVCGHYVAVYPDAIKKAKKGEIILPEEFNADKAARAQAGEVTGVVMDVGQTAWHAYDKKSDNWKPWAEVGDRVWFQRHVAKVIEDKDDLVDGKPRKIFVMADENITWNEGKADE